jgi:hypothetical protein
MLRWPALIVVAALALAAAPPGATAQPELPARPGELQLGRLHYSGGGDWYGNPSSLPNLLEEFARRTGIDCAARETVVKATDPGLDRLPLVYLNGHGNIQLSAEEETRLRAGQHGGFLWADDNYGLDASFRRTVERLFPPSRCAWCHRPSLYHNF